MLTLLLGDDAFNDVAGAGAADEGEDDEAAAGFLDGGCFWDGLIAVVSTFDVDIGAERANNRAGGVFVEEQGVVDGVERRDEGQAILLAVNGPAWTLQAACTAVTVDGHDEDIAQLSGLAQEMNMSGVQNIEDAIGKDDGFPAQAFDFQRGAKPLKLIFLGLQDSREGT